NRGEPRNPVVEGVAMRPSLRAVMSLAGWLVVVLCLTGGQSASAGDVVVSLASLQGAYAKDPVKADKAYKGTILEVNGAGYLPMLTILRDAKGRKYVPLIGSTSSNPNHAIEIARCYLFRPEKPSIEEA